MNSLALDLLVVPLVLGCAAPIGQAQSEPVPRNPVQSGPIRFGDPEELAYSAPFFAQSSYDPKFTTPDAILGQKHGTRLAHHAEILACFRAWAAQSSRVRVETFVPCSGRCSV